MEEQLFVIDTQGETNHAKRKSSVLYEKTLTKSLLEEQLEKDLFGDPDILDKFEETEELKPKKRKNEKELESIEDLLKDSSDEEEELKPAWEDEDDATITVDISRLRSQKDVSKMQRKSSADVISGTEYVEHLRHEYSTMFAQSSDWAEIPDGEDEDSVSRKTVSVLGKGKTLSSGVMGIVRLGNANAKAKGFVDCLRFHPTTPLLLCAGARNIHVVQVTGRESSLIHKAFMSDLNVSQAEFSPSGDEVLVVGNKRHFYAYDVPTGSLQRIDKIIGRPKDSISRFEYSPDGKYIAMLGSDGTLPILSSITKQWAFQLKMNDPVRAAVFHPNGYTLYSTGSREVYEWDLRTRRCVHKFYDEGCLQGMTMDLSRNYLTIGSSSGVVNMYDINTITSSQTPKPYHSFTNLVHEIGGVRLNHDAQLVSFFANEEPNAVRMGNVPSRSVYTNWPGRISRIGKVKSLDFSPHSGFFVVGHGQTADLFRIPYYSDY